MKHSESLKEIAGAIGRAQMNIKGAIKDAANPFFKSKYADLESCWEAVRSPLHKEGLSIVQTMGFIPGAGPTVITTLLHASGEYISGEQPVCAKSDDPQGLGSAITYARRYGLSAITGLIQVDDDAEGSMKRPGGSSETRPPASTGVVEMKHGQPVEKLGAFVFTFGKYKTKRLDEIGEHDLNSWLSWMDSQPDLNDRAAEAVATVSAYLTARERKAK